MAVSEKSISDKIETSSVVEQLEKEIEENDTTFDEKYSHKKDLEKLLSLAEDLKEKCDKTKNRITYYRILQITFVITFMLWTFWVLFYNLTENKYLVVIAGLSGSILAIFSFQYVLINDDRKKYLGDKSALSEVLQLLRETSNVIAEQEKWSVLSRAEFRIRLSRFNLEEKSKSAFNFFS